MPEVQYRITERGQRALEEGDDLMQLANDAAQDGVVSSKELTQLGIDEITADYVLSVLSRLTLIEQAPIQGVSYTTPGKYN